jgi:hypothetical protein
MNVSFTLVIDMANHAQFFGPQAVDGNISSGTWGGMVDT